MSNKTYQTSRTFHVRIKTKRGYIAISYAPYGDYAVYEMDENMKAPKARRIEQWVYTTVHSNAVLEHGLWEVEDTIQTAQFGDLARDEDALTEILY